MADGFVGGLYQHLLFWSGWVFTVGGAVASLWVGREYGWIGTLFAFVGLLALTGFAYQKHRQLRDAELRHRAEKDRLDTDIRAARAQAEQADRKLNQIPADILLRLEQVIRTHSFAELAGLLGDHAEYVERMLSLAQLMAKPIPLRTFAKRAGALYVEAKLSADALQYLRQDDPFLLEFKDPTALITQSALAASTPV